MAEKTFFGNLDAERFSATSLKEWLVDEMAQTFMQERRVELKPGRTLGQLLLDQMEFPIVVGEYKPVEITNIEKERWASFLVEELLERMDEEHGNPDSGTDATPEMRKAALAFVNAVCNRYRVWPCDRVAEHIVTKDDAMMMLGGDPSNA